MKSLFLLPIILAILILPTLSLAAGLVPCNGLDCEIEHVIGRDGVINRLVKFIFDVVLVPLSAGIIIYAGISILLNAGNPDKIGEAKKLIYNTLIGFIIVLCAFLIVQLIVRTLASPETDSGKAILDTVRGN